MKLFGYLVCFIFAFSIVSAGTMICIDKTSPSAPADLSVSGNVGSILLEWNNATDEPNCSGIAEYVVSRGGSEIGRVDGITLSFIDDESLGEGEYTYTVYAVDLVGRNTGSAIKNIIEIKRGSSSGGSSGNSYVCVENWVCEEWTECVGNEQRRLCEDLNECGVENDKPETYQECGLVSEAENLNSSFADVGSDDEAPTGFFSAITGAVVGGGATTWSIAGLFVLLIAGGFAFVKLRKK